MEDDECIPIETIECGANSHPISDTQCECDYGFRQGGPGEGCILSSTLCGKFQERFEDDCVCIDGYIMRASECYKECTSGMEPDSSNTKCVCRDDWELYDGKCKSKCSNGYIRDEQGRCKKKPESTTNDILVWLLVGFVGLMLVIAVVMIVFKSFSKR